jgi:hypothetical protein
MAGDILSVFSHRGSGQRVLKRLCQVCLPILVALSLALSSPAAGARTSLSQWHRHGGTSGSVTVAKPTAQPSAGDPDVGQTSSPPPRLGLISRPATDGWLATFLERVRMWIGKSSISRFPR